MRSVRILENEMFKGKRKQYSRRWITGFLCLYFSFFIYFIIVINMKLFNSSVPQSSKLENKTEQETISAEFLVDTSGCRIPYLDAFDPLIRKYIFEEDPIQCTTTLPLLVDSNLTSLYVVKSALTAYGIKDINELTCYYIPFGRDVDYADDRPLRFNSFKTDISLEEEFVKVVCSKKKKMIFKNFYAFVPLKPEIEERCHKINENISKNCQTDLSVLIIGTDGVSRLNFHRQMPNTIKLLQNIDSIELVGYNKVADNTFPNIVPILTGYSKEELEDLCWPSTHVEFDNCPWIWKNFSSAGYRTVMGEDALGIGAFTLDKTGFIQQPTDYDLRPFMKKSEAEIGNNHKYYSKLCLGSQLTTEVLLNYITKFVTKMFSKKYFGYFWATSLTHDNINYPRFGDNIYKNFITHLITNGLINNTVLILLSDHGTRYGKLRETYQGRLEERLPFLYFILPKWFQDVYPEAITNLRRNSHRLTSPFDVYETLLDILNNRLENTSIQRRKIYLEKVSIKPRGISLFLPIHESRTCEDTGIDPLWCTCQKNRSSKISTEDPFVQKLSSRLVNHLNSLVKQNKNCSKLHLTEIKSAHLEIPPEGLYGEESIEILKDYILVIKTRPGDGFFEGTFRYSVETGDVQIVGTVSRINAYGNQSECIRDSKLKLYCFCTSQSKKKT